MKLVILSAITTLALSVGCDRPKEVPSTTTTTSSDYATPDASFVPSNSDTATISGGVEPGAPSPMDTAYRPGHMGHDRNGAGAAITGDGGTSANRSHARPTLPGQPPPNKPSAGTGTPTGAGNATGAVGN